MAQRRGSAPSAARTGVVRRDRLLRKIGTAEPDVVAVIAAAGYGKTTLLTALAEDDPRPVAWLALDVRDDDPSVLLADLAFALDRIHRLEQALLRRLTASGSRVPAARIRDLTRYLERDAGPVLIVLDDLHVLASLGSLDIVSALIDRLPTGSAIAFASRVTPDLHLARATAAGRLLMLDELDLAMDEEETASVMRAGDLHLPQGAVAEVARRTEGWPLAIRLAIRSIRDAPDPVEAASRFGGEDRVLADYVRDELLRHLPARHRRFMTRTSILDELTPELCDKVAGMRGSSALLPELERSNAFVVPLIDRPSAYRYHQLFREVLQEELRRQEPDLVPDLYRRAAAWCASNGMTSVAIDYAQAGGDVEEAARLVCSVLRMHGSAGRFQTLARWLTWFDESAMLAYPPLAVAAGWYHAFVGDEDPVYWLRIAEVCSFDGPTPDGAATFESSVALLRAALCPNGPQSMDDDVQLAAELGSAASDWRIVHHLLAGEACLLLGENERATRIFHDGVELAGPTHPGGHVMLLTELASIAVDEGAWDAASAWTGRARALATSAGLGDLILQPLTFAVSALVSIHQGDVDRARRELTEAQKLRVTSSFTIPTFSIRGRLAMARAYLELSDVEGARTVLREARDFHARRPRIGTLADALDEMERAVREARSRGMTGAATLSAAELRVLTLLPTHLSFREIGERLFVSPNTVKTQAMSIYHKLGASSRSAAIERAAELGLLDL